MNIEVKNSVKLVDYIESMQILEKRVKDVLSGKNDELLWILEHNTVYTAGTNSKEEDVLDKNLKIIKTNRGGKHTLHSPGQKVIYFVLNLNKRKKDIRVLVQKIEKCIIEVLKEYKISFKLRPHPLSFKKKEISLSELKKENIPVDNLKYIDFQKYDFLISDWSGIFIEYALIFRRRAFLINTPKKIVNNEYFKHENKPIEISLRNTLARSFEISEIPEIIKEILSQKNLQKNKDSNNEIDKIIKSNFY